MKDWIDIDDGEEILHAKHPSKWRLLPAVASSALVAGMGIALVLSQVPNTFWPVETPQWQVGLLFILGSPVLPALREWKRRSIYYVVTNKQIIHKRGIFSRDDDPVPHGEIVNYSVKQTAADRFLGKGTLALATAGSDGYEIKFRDIHDCQQVKRTLSNYVKEKERRRRI